ncbi:FAD-dependent oxidoreductase [Chelativorans alearense]|uniref:oxidoreductase n=1 Tax=Chelativorans alearense TaxID=2681495 RepID=UPI0013D7951C|nr:FAD-dependent oxidoreductase [Chelativorans alearense]
MQIKYPHLFEPLTIGKVRLKNRIAMAPMGFPALQDEEGLPTQRYVDYFVERAKGGAGLLHTGMLKVEDEIEHSSRKRGPVRAAFIRPIADLTEAVHSLGAKFFVQLSPGFGSQARPGTIRGGPVAPSAVPNFGDPKITCRALKTEEVEALVKAYGRAAEIVARAGCDGIELHGHGGFLLDQFTCSFWNRRDDKYGGDLCARLTFPFEILREIKSRVSEDFPVTYRYGLKHYMKSLHDAGLPGETFTEVGRDIDEGLEMARLLEEAGFDGLAVDAGAFAGHYWTHPPIYQDHGCMLSMSAMVKKVVTIPVMTVGRLDVPDMAERAIASGEADIVAIGKGLLADPYWPNKVRAGHVEDIRPCIGCHQACTEVIHGRDLNSCTVNPACGRERTHTPSPALVKKKVLVAGGGAAGMEAARVAAARGHEVILYEKETELGGHLRDASVPDDKKDVGRLNTWYQRQLSNLDIPVRAGTAVTPAIVEAERPDVIVVASGSTDIMPKLPGADLPHVVPSTGVLLGRYETGENVIVVGAGENGCELALWLARKGKRVRIVERLSRPVAIPVARANRNMLLDLLAFHQVPILTDTALEEVRVGSVVVSRADGAREEIDCDTVVMAVGVKAEPELYVQLVQSFPGEVYSIGDCDGPRNIMKAVWDGFEVGRSI